MTNEVASNTPSISVPTSVQGKMAPILFMMLLLILLWLSNTGKLTSLIALFTALPPNPIPPSVLGGAGSAAENGGTLNGGMINPMPVPPPNAGNLPVFGGLHTIPLPVLRNGNGSNRSTIGGLGPLPPLGGY